MNLTDMLKTADLYQTAVSRRQFFRENAMGLGSAALASLLSQQTLGAAGHTAYTPGIAHFPAKAKRVIYISLIGAPSQFETFDYKPHLKKEFKKDIKDFLLASGQRLTGISAKQSSFPVAPSFVDFKQHGESGMWVSDLLPHTAKMADDILNIVKQKLRSFCDESVSQGGVSGKSL